MSDSTVQERGLNTQQAEDLARPTYNEIDFPHGWWILPVFIGGCLLCVVAVGVLAWVLR